MNSLLMGAFFASVFLAGFYGQDFYDSIYNRGANSVVCPAADVVAAKATPKQGPFDTVPDRIQYDFAVSATTKMHEKVDVEMSIYGDVNFLCWNEVEAIIDEAITDSMTSDSVPTFIDRELNLMDNETSGCDFDMLSLTVFGKPPQLGPF